MDSDATFKVMRTFAANLDAMDDREMAAMVNWISHKTRAVIADRAKHRPGNSDHKGFECLGFAVYCDNCGRRHSLPAAESLERAIEDAKEKGLVVEGDAQFCSESCRREDAGEICQHTWPRSGPKAFVCVKCGHRDE